MCRVVRLVAYVGLVGGWNEEVMIVISVKFFFW